MRRFQRLTQVARRLFETLDSHPDLKDADALNLKQSIFDIQDGIATAAKEHDAFAENFNGRLRQVPEKWFAEKFKIIPHYPIWSSRAINEGKF